MALYDITYEYSGCLPSCINGRLELQVGESVQLDLEPKNPLWPDKIIAEVTSVTRTPQGRTYTFRFDSDDLNGGPVIESCDFGGPSPVLLLPKNFATTSNHELRHWKIVLLIYALYSHLIPEQLSKVLLLLIQI